MTAPASVDHAEVAGFEAMAARWWDSEGPMRPLHQLNPSRLRYARDRLCARFGRDPDTLRPFAGLRLLDAGCGAGLLSEPLARLGATVTAIDAGAEVIEVARQHAAGAGLEIDYRCASAEALVDAGERFDAVISMEVIEHVADLSAFLAALATLTRPGGALVLSTLNRTARAFATAIVGAEYVLRWLPAGTHNWHRFVRPAELNRRLRPHGVRLEDVTGLSYRPAAGEWRLSRDSSVNYLAFAGKAGGEAVQD